ncbi:hypothetical protein JIG36_36815 [Actinoplanes sp. LDG1-06]|uniref:Uncharacterized protein n=1 Tax=Paractinoplanes ovalisporus TaxID=2810368 RepID=A0ABS2AMS9_9ACTN|nr:hypothetical protein [Actinoplanes ovalisporus]MBM2621078.1 hypothetical protein [Actinoplanes ovalisporus]
MIDGRYDGANGRFLVELRIDQTGDDGRGVISGDVALSRAAGPAYLASFRTSTALAATPGGPWAVVCDAQNGDVTRGTVQVRPDGADAVAVEFKLDGPLNGLPFGTVVKAALKRQGEAYRQLGVETEIEEGVALPKPVDGSGIPVTFKKWMAYAGVEVVPAGDKSLIPAHNGGWDWNEANVLGVISGIDQFNLAMSRYTELDLDVPAWQVHMLMLSEPTRPELYGVMFDLRGDNPRQGCAIFVDEIRRSFANNQPERQILWTMVHEVGHALNLTHRFEPAIGRNASTSFMNYPWEYLGGKEEEQYWLDSKQQFDPDELAFLRHGNRSSVIPGGAEFHSFDYWSLAPGGKPAFTPTLPDSKLQLKLVPKSGDPFFAFGQQVQLKIALLNRSGQTIVLPAGALDIKAGYLGISVRRTTRNAPPPQSFVPMVQRCLNQSAGQTTLETNRMVESNVSLWFGAGGFPMAEPGGYELTPVLSLSSPDPSPDESPLVVVGAPLKVWIEYPKTRDDERHGVQLLEPDVGAFQALGGGNACGSAADTVQAIQEERVSRFGMSDPLAASLTRTLGIHYSRAYLTYGGKRFAPGRADNARAGRLLSRLTGDPVAMLNFDEVTARETRELAERVLHQ